MSFPRPRWNRDHVIIPSKLLEYVNNGYELSIRIRRKMKLTTINESILRKCSSDADVMHDKIWEPQLYLEKYLSDVNNLFDQGFKIVVNIKSDKIEVCAEKAI